MSEGRFTPIDDSTLSNLLSPRPFSRQNQYSSVRSGSSTNPTSPTTAAPRSAADFFDQQQQEMNNRRRQQFPTSSPFDRDTFGSMDRSGRRFPDSDWDSGPGSLGSFADGFSSLPRRLGQHFPSAQQLHEQQRQPASRIDPPSSFFDDSASSPFDHRRFFSSGDSSSADQQRRQSPRMTPMMPEWGYSAGSGNGNGNGFKQQRSAPFRTASPFGSESNLSGGSSSTMAGKERVIPIRVEGSGRTAAAGGPQTRAPPMGETTTAKPAPPVKPPELRNYPPREHYQQRPPMGTSNTMNRQQQEPAPFTITQQQQQQQRRQESAVPVRPQPVPVPQNVPVIPEFKPEVLLKKASEAPNLVGRLAGKTTSFDEFADVLSKLPKPPRSTFDEFDENLLSEMISNKNLRSGSTPKQANDNSNIQQQQGPTPVTIVQKQGPTAPPINNNVQQQQGSTVMTPPDNVGDNKTRDIVGDKFPTMRDVKENLPPVPPPPPSAESSQTSFSCPQDEAPNVVRLFDDALQESLQEFLAAGQKIGGDVNDISNLTKQAIDAQRTFIWNASGTKKPTDDDQFALQLKPISEKIEAIQTLKNDKRTSPNFNHLSAIAEGIPALGWVTVSPTPAPFIKEMLDASQFYVNRVLKDFKEQDKTHVDWAKAWLKILSSLQTYVKQNHTTGLVWNSSPGATAPGGGKQAAPSGPAALPPGPPGPPPPPPPDFFADATGGAPRGSDKTADSRAALFAEINKGMDITKGLKKVTDDMQTHKNPVLRGADMVPASSAPGSAKATASSPASSPSSRPPKIELEGGKKWVVEYLNNNKNAVIEAKDMKQVVYIFKCVNSVIQIKGKLNSITMDSCNKTSLVFDDLVSSVEIINCQSVQIQSMGTMPTLLIQKTDGCQIYLSKASLNSEIVTSKSSEMNVLVPKDNGEFDEFAVPEQYKTVWNGKKLQTNVVDIA